MRWVLTIQTQEGAAEHGEKPIALAQLSTRRIHGRRQGFFVAETSPWIAIVDDDPAVLRALSRLLRSRAFRVNTYGSSHDFLAAALADSFPSCLIVDFQMPEMNGLELHQHLMNNRIVIPTILVTAHGDAAIHFPPAGDTFVARLRKPLDEKALFSAIDRAIGSSGDIE